MNVNAPAEIEINIETVKCRVVESLSDVPSQEWDLCLEGTRSPFSRHSFLYGLELCECVGETRGWLPRYVIIETEAGQLIACAAAYLKTHSQGEFIFDWSWADAAHRAGLPYYPKLTVTSPFSPITGDKLLLHPKVKETPNVKRALQKKLIEALRELTHAEAATGLHLLFVTEEEQRELDQSGFLIRETLQFQWKNEGYQSFDEFLERFRSKRRNQIKRERRRVLEAGIHVRVYQGEEIQPEHILLMYRYYRYTVEKYYFGNLYLNFSFFEHLFRTQREDLCLLIAERGGQAVGGSFNLYRDGVLFGRYWGCEPYLDLDALHFEVCAYRGIELCIERGWHRFEAGAGGGGHKFGRGFLPHVIYSAHEVYLPGFQRALTAFLEEERIGLSEQLSQIENEVLKAR